MENTTPKSTSFSLRSFLIATIPSYIFPASMSWVSGWFMKNTELMQASYTTIAITSLLAAILCYTLLWIMQKFQFFLVNKLIRTVILTSITVGIALIIVNFTALKPETFNILVSSILGSSITTWKQPLSKTK